MNQWLLKYHRKIMWWTLVCLCLFAFFLSSRLYTHQNLEIVFLDVGQGDATLITTPNGRHILIDTGAKNNLGQKLARYMPVSDRSLDLVIMTHPDLDHVGGMVSLLDRYDIHRIMHSGLLAGSPLYVALAQGIHNRNIPTITAEAGQRILLDHDVYLEVYSPYPGFESFESNDFSIVVKLVHGNNSVLLTGDATKNVEYELVNTYGDLLQSQILKVGHHGSQTSSSEYFLKHVGAKYGIISASCDNRFGHPHAVVLGNLLIHQVEILDTCNDGDIVFESNGKEWKRKKAL